MLCYDKHFGGKTMSQKKQMCMTCKKKKATVFVGKAAFCISCNNMHLSAIKNPKELLPKYTYRDPSHYSGQAGAPGGAWDHKNR